MCDILSIDSSIWQKSCCWHEISGFYLLCRNGIFLEEKISKLCILFGCVAWASIPAHAGVNRVNVIVVNIYDFWKQVKNWTDEFSPLKQASQDVKGPLLALPPWQLRPLVFIYLHRLLHRAKKRWCWCRIYNVHISETQQPMRSVRDHWICFVFLPEEHLYQLLSSGFPSTLSGSVCWWAPGEGCTAETNDKVININI